MDWSDRDETRPAPTDQPDPLSWLRDDLSPVTPAPPDEDPELPADAEPDRMIDWQEPAEEPMPSMALDQGLSWGADDQPPMMAEPARTPPVAPDEPTPLVTGALAWDRPTQSFPASTPEPDPEPEPEPVYEAVPPTAEPALPRLSIPPYAPEPEPTREQPAPAAQEWAPEPPGRTSDIMATAAVSAVLEHLTELGPRLDALEAALVANSNMRASGDVLANLSDRLEAVERAIRVIGGRLSQSTHLQPAVESLRKDVATLTVKTDPRAVTAELVRLVRESISSEMATISRDLSILQSAVDRIQAISSFAESPPAGSPRPDRGRGRLPADDEPQDHPWWREP